MSPSEVLAESNWKLTQHWSPILSGEICDHCVYLNRRASTLTLCTNVVGIPGIEGDVEGSVDEEVVAIPLADDAAAF